MSRLGNRAIPIPEDVDVKVDGQKIIAFGPEGELFQELVGGITAEVVEDSLVLNRRDDSNEQKSKHGLMWSLAQNIVNGVTEPFTKTLVLNGLGYRAKKQGNELVLELGFSEPVKMEIPDNLSAELPNRTTIKISGIDKEEVGQFASRLRGLRDPDPYNQKGIKYEGEYIRQKVGKTVGGEGALGEE